MTLLLISEGQQELRRQKVLKVKVLVAQSCPTLCDSWTVAHQAPLSMEFSRQEYWTGLPCPSLGDRPDPGIKFEAPALKTDSVPSEPPGKPLRRQKRGDQKHSRRESYLCSVILLEGKENSDIWRSRSWGAGVGIIPEGGSRNKNGLHCFSFSLGFWILSYKKWEIMEVF